MKGRKNIPSKQIVSNINTKRSSLGMNPIKPAEASVYKKGSVVDSLSSMGDWISDVVSTDYKTRDVALQKA